MVFIFSWPELNHQAFQPDDLANTDEKQLIANTIDFIINNRQKITLLRMVCLTDGIHIQLC